MKVATWNVNGIRAREAQLCDWIARDRPDVVCLQEIKARPDQVPDRCKLADYHAFWHGGGGYSGVSLHLRRELLETPAFSHPEFDMETRIVQVALGNLVLASVYVPNGGKDYAAKIRFVTALAAWAKQVHDDGRELDPVRRHQHRPRRHRRPSQGAQGGRHRAAAGGARALRGAARRPIWSTSRACSIPTIPACSRGGRRGATCASATSAGASTTSSPPARSPERATSCTVLADVGTSDHAPLMMTTT